MATAKKLPSGSWRCRVFDHDEIVTLPDGTRKKKKIMKSFTCDDPSPKGKRTCERMAAEWAESKESPSSRCSLTFDSAVGSYIESRKNVLSPSTIRDYTNIRKHHIDLLKDKKVSDITQKDIQDCINADAVGHSPKTVRNTNGLITAVLSAYRPEFKPSTKLPAKVRPNLYIPTNDDVKALMEAVKGTRMELPILLAAFGPMRRGEICALDSSNINGNIVHVCQNMVRTPEKTWLIKSPKTYAGDRFIQYPDFVAEKWKGKEGRIVDMNPGEITDSFARLLKSIKMQHFRFHDLRHYSASIQHAIGIPDAYIMQRGGWSSDTVLKTVYRHVLEQEAEAMNNKANDYFKTLYD